MQSQTSDEEKELIEKEIAIYGYERAMKHGSTILSRSIFRDFRFILIKLDIWPQGYNVFTSHTSAYCIKHRVNK